MNRRRERILLLGSGGREHALAWKAAQSPIVQQVYVAPGNAGTAQEPGVTNVDLEADRSRDLIDFARQNSIDLTLVGPEAPLAAGIVDEFTAAGLPCLGPSAAVARLEASKSFAKDFLKRHGIPTAEYSVFESLEPALDHVRAGAAPYVLKADGLAGGKGVVIARTLAEAETSIRDLLGGRLGKAGKRIVIEEFLQGEEASFIVLADGLTALPFASSQDHKPIGDADQGPNTGGMGACSPAPVISETVHKRVLSQIIQPTLAGLAAENLYYRGFLYAGLMIDPEGHPKVIEFNCRFGDPETQPIMMRMQTDLVALCHHAMNGTLAGQRIRFDPRPALTVVMASGGYPGSYATGDVITGLNQTVGDTRIFHAGTRTLTGQVVTSGGRVLGVTALGNSLADARSRAYAVASGISWRNEYHRSDIGLRALQREQRPEPDPHPASGQARR